MRNLKKVLLFIFTLTFLSCGLPPGTLVVDFHIPTERRVFQLLAKDREELLDADRGKIILENNENRIEVAVNSAEKDKKIEDIPPGTYSLTIVFYKNHIITAWGYIPSVKIKKNVETHLSVALKIQKEWE